MSQITEEPKKHVVVKGDVLWNLAGYYYQNSFAWPTIWDANKKQIQNPDLIYPGQEFLIPGQVTRIETRTPSEVVAMTSQKSVQVPQESPLETEPELPKEKVFTPQPETLSEDFPPQMTGMHPSLPRLSVPLNWQQDGEVIRVSREDKSVESLAEKGDVVVLRLREPIQPGAALGVFRKMGYSKDEKGIKGLDIQKTGQLKVLSVQGNQAMAKVTRIHDAVQVGDFVKAE
ncbi:MAG: LysM peptidoglycan-binding domain-containing protein [Elusimicrobia bacterium]|nr:LysM peptidoglycan-binding domain-containing protein [Elusimicrobiota bacterium]